MGLDMYIERMPRYKNTTPHGIRAIEYFLDWKNNPMAQQYTMEEWCGININDVPSQEVFDFYMPYYTMKYYSWDNKKRHGRNMIKESIADWRKANAIHKWFVENVQDGIDDCEYHHEVTKEILEELLCTCYKVLDSITLTQGKVTNGYKIGENLERVPILEDGSVIHDPSIAMNLLPTTDGFFFGCTDYDDWYVSDIQDTIAICKKVIETTDFETQMIYYRSSW